MPIPSPPLSEILALWPEILLSLGACALLLFDLLTSRDRKAVLGWICFGLVMVTLLGTLLQPPQGGSIFGGMFLADGYAAFFKVLFLIAAALTVLISLRYLDDEGIHRGEYYALVLFATVGMMFMAGGGDFITIYLGLELMSLSTYVLVGFIRRDGASTEGAVKYFLMGAFTSGILLYGLALLYGLTGSTNLAAVAQSLSGLSLDNPALVLATILVVVGFGFKIAAVPFHMWAPDTYEGAPTSITAFHVVGGQGRGLGGPGAGVRRCPVSQRRNLGSAVVDSRCPQHDPRQRGGHRPDEPEAHAGVFQHFARRLRPHRRGGGHAGARGWTGPGRCSTCSCTCSPPWAPSAW